MDFAIATCSLMTCTDVPDGFCLMYTTLDRSDIGVGERGHNESRSMTKVGEVSNSGEKRRSTKCLLILH